MNNKELPPCPFCGGEANILQHKDGIDDWIVFCKKCGCQTDFMFTEYEAIHAWNARSYPLDKLEDVAFLSEIQDFVKFCRNASAKDIRQIHDRARDLIENYKKCCNKSCKQENATLKPLVPKWGVLDSCMLDVPISQRETLQFTIRKLGDNEYWCEVGISIWESLADYTEEVGTFKTLEEAKAKANECIRELGERLMYFADEIRTTDELES